MISDTLRNFVLERLRMEAEGVLDDPGTFTRKDKYGDDIGEWLIEMRAVAAEVGTDFDALLACLGTGFERNRLQEIIAGAAR